jgi:small subunit ribosomal protein S6
MANHTYEMLYILSPVLREEEVKEHIEKLNAMITENGGSIQKQDNWGAKKLAYPIDKKRTGVYVNTYFDAPGDLIARLKRSMEINDNFMRYIILKMDANALRQYKKRSEQAAA